MAYFYVEQLKKSSNTVIWLAASQPSHWRTGSPKSWEGPVPPGPHGGCAYATDSTRLLVNLLITYRIHNVMLLESNQCVGCVLIDITKAFDMVDDATLARTLFSLQVPGSFFFLTDHTQ